MRFRDLFTRDLRAKARLVDQFTRAYKAGDIDACERLAGEFVVDFLRSSDITSDQRTFIQSFAADRELVGALVHDLVTIFLVYIVQRVEPHDSWVLRIERIKRELLDRIDWIRHNSKDSRIDLRIFLGLSPFK